MTPPPMVGYSGRLTRHPSLRSGRTGAFATVGLLVRSRTDEPELVEVVAFGAAAVPLSELRKGERVVVAGRLEARSWTDPTGTPRTADRLVAVAVGRDISPDPRPPRGIPDTAAQKREGGTHG